MPAKLAAEFELNPGATVKDATDSPMVVKVVLDCGAAPAQEGYVFYMKQAAEGDWKHPAEREFKGKRTSCSADPPQTATLPWQCRWPDHGHHKPHERLHSAVKLSRRRGVSVPHPCACRFGIDRRLAQDKHGGGLGGLAYAKWQTKRDNRNCWSGSSTR